MTTDNYADDNTKADELDLIEEASSIANAILQRRIEAIDKARAEQPERLAKARAEADEARGWAIIEEPWDGQWSAVPGYNRDGDITAMLALPNITAKELFGARLAFDMLDCGEDFDRIDEVQSRYFTMVGGDPGMMFLLAMSAMSTIAGIVVPQMLDDLERSASNYDARVLLAEARAKSWRGRVSELRGLHDHVDEAGDAEETTA